MKILPREEYVEQAYMFRALAERLASGEPIQQLLSHIKEEILATTKLPMAIDFFLAELNHSGSMAEAMGRMQHYFAPFQTYLIAQAEDDHGRMDLFTTLQILEHEAKFRGLPAADVSMFFFQLEIICRNRLSYDHGLAAMSKDPIYGETWSSWLLDCRQKLGIVDVADLIFVHSQHYVNRFKDTDQFEMPDPVLFGEKEGRIALANRRKDPLFLFSALQRQLDYPSVPRPKRHDPQEDLLPQLIKLTERLETRVKLLEDEQRETGIDLHQFYKPPE